MKTHKLGAFQSALLLCSVTAFPVIFHDQMGRSTIAMSNDIIKRAEDVLLPTHIILGGLTIYNRKMRPYSSICMLFNSHLKAYISNNSELYLWSVGYITTYKD